jgi:hypothetical protein
MFQRIQSVYLLISLVAWTMLFLFPVIGFTNDAGESWKFLPKGIVAETGGKAVVKTIPLFILFLVIEHLVLMGLLSFKKRMAQLRMTVLGMFLQVFSYGLIVLYTFQGKNVLNAKPELLFWTIMPLIAAISSYFAFRGIRRDIVLLRAQDRIR